MMKKNVIAILSAILVIMLSLDSMYLALSDSVSRDNVKSNIKNDLLSGFIYDEEGNKTEIFKTLLRLTTLDEETIIKMMENETMDELLTDVVNSIYDYNLTGDSSYKYTGSKIISLVEDNMDKILSEINYTISSEDRKEVIDYVHNNTDYIIDTIYSTDIGDYTR